MGIIYNDKEKIIHLFNNEISYIIGINSINCVIPKVIEFSIT